MSELTTEDVNLCNTDPAEVVKSDKDPVTLSEGEVENKTGAVCEEKISYPLVTENEKETGLKNPPKAIKEYGCRTGIDPSDSYKIITSEVNNYKSELVEKANFFKSGDLNLDIDNSAFWLWEHKSRDFFFVAKDGENISCLDSCDLWKMDKMTAENVTFIDVLTGASCVECKYSDNCSRDR